MATPLAEDQLRYIVDRIAYLTDELVAEKLSYSEMKEIEDAYFALGGEEIEEV